MCAHLIGPPHVIEAVLFVLALHDLELVLDAALPEDGTLEEGDEALESVLERGGRNIEVEIGVLGGGVSIGTAATLTWK